MAIETRMRVPYAYVDREFADPEPYLDDLRDLARSGDFTLGRAVSEFEGRAITFTGLPHAVGVSNGTEALTLVLRALGIGPGSEVITATNSFVASAGAIAMAGATPVLVDVTDDFTIDPNAVEAAITPQTAAILPVHLTGQLADMPRLMTLANAYILSVVEDAAQAMGATLDGQHAGSWGSAAGISMHPLKMLNVWGDGGIVLTKSRWMDASLRRLRNHGLASRDDAVVFGANGRLSSLQAVIANRVIQGLPRAIARRRELAVILNTALDNVEQVRTPITRPGVNPVWMTYIIRADDRDGLRAHLLERGVDVKVHYPVPLHLQTVGQQLGYRAGQMPVAERHAREILTLPLHEYLTDDEVYYMADQVKAFYR